MFVCISVCGGVYVIVHYTRLSVFVHQCVCVQQCVHVLCTLTSATLSGVLLYLVRDAERSSSSELLVTNKVFTIHGITVNFKTCSGRPGHQTGKITLTYVRYAGHAEIRVW